MDATAKGWFMQFTTIDPVYGTDKDRALYLELKHKINALHEFKDAMRKTLESLEQVKQEREDEDGAY